MRDAPSTRASSSSPSRVPLLCCVLLCCVLLGGASPGLAKDRGFYVNGKLGSTDVEQSFGDTVEQLVDGDEDSYALELGFRFSKYLGVQAGYHDFGAFSGLLCDTSDCGQLGGSDPLAVLDAETKAYSVTGVLRLPLPLGFAIFGKAGFAFLETEIDVLDDQGVSEFLDDFSDEDLIFGVGVSWNLPGPLSVFAEWEQIAGDIETISLGLSLSF
ncbi:MAG TPA: outer membrane beta-barrel protein [Thermoanaerobaculia bacterium]|nr:outer membrane beta-barrel protein [Thermoanaerobaculia bacterium]